MRTPLRADADRHTRGCGRLSVCLYVSGKVAQSVRALEYTLSSLERCEADQLSRAEHALEGLQIGLHAPANVMHGTSGHTPRNCSSHKHTHT